MASRSQRHLRDTAGRGGQDSGGHSAIVVTTPPSITGGAASPTVNAAGTVLTRVNAVVTGPNPQYANQWTRNNVNIAGATGVTYTIVAEDAGAQIRIKQTISNDYGPPAVSTSTIYRQA